MENEAFASNEALIKERKEKFLGLFKAKSSWIVYIALAIIVFITTKIRLSNVSKLKDITTGTWTLAPDLDPFLFLRWAEYIVQHGKLYAIDMMRYVPLGLDTNKELLLHPYMIAWFHKFTTIFGNASVTYSAIIYPVVMFALTVVAFFFLTREIFVDSLGEKKSSIIALISSFLLSFSPSLLMRTVAGVPEKECAAFLFMFLSFYLFIKAWKSKTLKFRYGLAFLAGLSTAAMSLIWGGFIFVFVTIALATMVAFLLGKMKKDDLIVYSIWLAVSFFIMNLATPRFNYISLFSSFTTGAAVLTLFVCAVHLLIFNTRLSKYFESQRLSKIPRQAISLVLSLVVIAIITSILFGPSFMFSQLAEIKQTLITPTINRLGVTVAENRQPFFDEWSSSFGPIIKNIPIFFWLFFFGSIYLFYHMIKSFEKKERRIVTASYALFLFAVIFSRYKSDGMLNGTNTISMLVYFAGCALLIGVFGYYYYKYYKSGRQEQLREIDFSLVILFVLFFLSIVSARGAVRLIMVLVPPTAIIASYFVVGLFDNVKHTKDEVGRIIIWIIFGLVVISLVFASFKFYQETKYTAENYAPNSAYAQQWQKAMGWVRNNTPENAVFGHWWDYGYWLQSIGKRATVLDGGNAISYWDHLMGRYALTGTSSLEAAEFLYAHNTTHFLIDSTDIGKYSAYSSIGSDKDYDRNSWIPTLQVDEKQTMEKKNSRVYVYQGGFTVDEDIVYEQNGTKVFLPKGKAGIGAVILDITSEGEAASAPEVIYVYQENQHRLPLRYAYVNGKLSDFGSGVESGVFVFPRLSNQMNSLNSIGAMLYLSKRTINSQLVRLYLFNENDAYFKLVHSEDSPFVAQIKSQNILGAQDFVYFQGLQGPIKIWEINYPKDIKFKEEFLSTIYPEEIRWA